LVRVEKNYEMLHINIECAHHELRGKCLSGFESPPKCPVTLLHLLG